MKRVRRPDPDVNPPSETSGNSGADARQALLTLRTAFVLTGGFVVGVAVGILTYFGIHQLPAAILAGIPACAAGITFLHNVIA
jgi:hypothetical protein